MFIQTEFDLERLSECGMWNYVLPLSWETVW
jgi:hypothetical protein